MFRPRRSRDPCYHFRDHTGSAMVLEHSWEFRHGRLFLLLTLLLRGLSFQMHKHSHTLHSRVNLQPPFSPRSTLVPPATLLGPGHYSGTGHAQTARPRWMPRILSVFEIRTRAPAPAGFRSVPGTVCCGIYPFPPLWLALPPSRSCSSSTYGRCMYK